MKSDSSIVLVTGGSAGLGRATAEYLCEKGFTVYSAARSFKSEGADERKGGGTGVLHKVFLDVTDDKSIDSLVQEIIRKEGRIDVLVNCAVFLKLGAVEDLDMEDFQSVMNTGFYGIVRMCRKVLPYMRERKKGLIINFSSGGGLVGLPFQGPYCSAKFAIEGFSEVLRWETKNFGIDVVIMEPGDSNAGSKSYRLRSEKSDSELSPYHGDFMTVTEKMESDEAKGAQGKYVAERVFRIISRKKPGIRYNAFRKTEKLLRLKMVLPSSIVEMIFFGYYNLKKET